MASATLCDTASPRQLLRWALWTTGPCPKPKDPRLAAPCPVLSLAGPWRVPVRHLLAAGMLAPKDVAASSLAQPAPPKALELLGWRGRWRWEALLSQLAAHQEALLAACLPIPLQVAAALAVCPAPLVAPTGAGAARQAQVDVVEPPMASPLASPRVGPGLEAWGLHAWVSPQAHRLLAPSLAPPLAPLLAPLLAPPLRAWPLPWSPL